MKFKIGNKQIFLKFFKSIDPKKDNVAILSHTDCDGISSAVLLDEILQANDIKPKIVEFLSYDKYMLEKVSPKLRKEKITKVFVLDLAVDNDNLDLFEKFRKEFSVFIIDHHLSSPDLKNLENIVKSSTKDGESVCATHMVYFLGKSLNNVEKLGWLVCAAIVADFQFNNSANFEFIKKFYPNVKKESIFDSEPGLNANIIDFTLIDFTQQKKDLTEVFNLIKEKNMKKLIESYGKIKKNIDEGVKNYFKKAEYYPERKLYFYYADSSGADTSSIVSTIVSQKYPDCTMVLVKNSVHNSDFLKISVRNQNASEDMNILMKKGIAGLENATGGGHVKASGGTIMKKDLEKFKENILKK